MPACRGAEPADPPKTFLGLGSLTLSDKVSKAASEGNVAAHSIIDYLAKASEI